MQKKLSYCVLCAWTLFCLCAFQTTKPAYQIFDQKGNISNYSKLIQEAKKADIVLFGELHNNPICHWLQKEVTQDLHQEAGKNLILGAEMFEADNQTILSEYTNGLIGEKQFKDEAKLWNNYATDYAPLVEFSKKNQIPFIATNIPRRYANMVAKKGLKSLETLSNEAKNWVAPLPITIDLELNAYKSMANMSHGASGGMGGGVVMDFASGQAVKDATMAHFILKNWQKGKIFLHYNGSYHSDNFESIVWYLQKQNKNLKILTISSVEQKNIEKLDKENENKANFIIAIPENMTKTY